MVVGAIVELPYLKYYNYAHVHVHADAKRF
jgi:hypothetical protein